MLLPLALNPMEHFGTNTLSETARSLGRPRLLLLVDGGGSRSVLGQLTLV